MNQTTAFLILKAREEFPSHELLKLTNQPGRVLIWCRELTSEGWRFDHTRDRWIAPTS